MIAALPILTNSVNAEISLKFSRCPYFAIINKTDFSVSIIENSFLFQNKCAGTSILDFLIANHNVNSLMAFELGLRVQQLAGKSGIRLVIIDDKKKTLKGILKLMKIKPQLNESN